MYRAEDILAGPVALTPPAIRTTEVPTEGDIWKKVMNHIVQHPTATFVVGMGYVLWWTGKRPRG